MTPAVDLGILGGMGPRATHYFTGEILKAIEVNHHPRRDQDYPSLIVRYACQIPDRTVMLTVDTTTLIEVISREAQTLVDLGCPAIIMPCITAHALLDLGLTSFPFIDVRKITADHIASVFSEATVGILATRGARLSRAVDKFLPSKRPAVILEEPEEQALMDFIYESAKNWSGAADTSLLKTLGCRLRDRGCDVIIAACSEVEMCLAQDQSMPNDFLLPLQQTAQFWAGNWNKL